MKSLSVHSPLLFFGEFEYEHNCRWIKADVKEQEICARLDYGEILCRPLVVQNDFYTFAEELHKEDGFKNLTFKSLELEYIYII